MIGLLSLNREGESMPKGIRIFTNFRFEVFRAWSVHFYTGLGLVLVLLSTLAIIQLNAFWAVMYGAMAMLVDATDGVLARKWEVRKWTRDFDGRKLDDIVDYLSYTFVPVLFAYRFEIVTGGWCAVLVPVLLASAYGFCRGEAKTQDGFFTGFPSYWNGVVLYLFWLDWPVWLAGVVLLIFAGLVFVPVKYIWLTKTRELRQTNLFLFLIWVGMLVAILADFQDPNPTLVTLSLFFPVYYFLVSLVLTLRNTTTGPPR